MGFGSSEKRSRPRLTRTLAERVFVRTIPNAVSVQRCRTVPKIARVRQYRRDRSIQMMPFRIKGKLGSEERNTGATLQIHASVGADFVIKCLPSAVDRDGSQFHSCYPIYRETTLSAWLLAHDKRHVGGTVACHHSNRNRACSRRVLSFFGESR